MQKTKTFIVAAGSLLCFGVGYISGAWRMGHRYIQKLDAVRKRATKFERWAMLYDVWMMTKKFGTTIEDYLLSQDIHEIAIYGMGLFGIRLFHELQGSEIKVLYGLAREAEFQTPGITIYSHWDASAMPVDAVIVTAFLAFPGIERELKAAGYQNVIALDELLYQLI